MISPIHAPLSFGSFLYQSMFILFSVSISTC